MPTYDIKCSEIWGGVHGANIDVNTSGIEASLFSLACDGGKGGDIYYFSVCGIDLLTRIAIADVMGHGQAVSDTSEWLYNSLKEKMNSSKDGAVLTGLNKQAVSYGHKAIATAASISIYNDVAKRKWVFPHKRTLRFAYAGHHPVLVRREGSAHWESIELPANKDTANLPLGVSMGFPYDQSTVTLSSGDMILLYTDGVIEAPNANDTLFEEPDLLVALEKAGDSPKAVKEAVLKALRCHTGGSFAHDDVTLMVIRVR